MLKISEFFKRIQGKQAKEFYLRSTIQEVFKQLIDQEVKTADITVNGDVLVLKNVSSAARSHIFIKKNLLLKEINARQEVKKIGDIRF